MDCSHTHRSAFPIERAHSANMTLKVSFGYKVCENSLVRSWRMPIKHCASSSERLDEFVWQHEKSESQRRQNRFAEAAHVNHPPRIVETPTKPSTCSREASRRV